MTIRLGLQINNFSYSTGVAELFPTAVAQAREADAAGFDSVLVMDHFYQLPGIGTPDQPMLEAYTALGALASATEHVQLGTLVTGNTYRNPTLLTKAITTLDAISQTKVLDAGIDGVVIYLPTQVTGYQPGQITALGEALKPLVAG